MSGHSKWSTIKHKKAARDHVKGNVFTKMANNIAVAVKKGGGIGDPDMNFSLRLAVDKARAVNMPGENIKRAIEKGMGKGVEDQLVEMTIEGIGPQGYSVIVEAITNNHTRTVNEVRLVMDKHGGKMGVPGCVMYKFVREAVIEYLGKLSDEGELLLIDVGAKDLEIDPENGVVYSTVELAKVVSDKLTELGMKVVDLTLNYRPLSYVEIDAEKVEEFLDYIRDLDDVSEVHTDVRVD